MAEYLRFMSVRETTGSRRVQRPCHASLLNNAKVEVNGVSVCGTEEWAQLASSCECSIPLAGKIVVHLWLDPCCEMVLAGRSDRDHR